MVFSRERYSSNKKATRVGGFFSKLWGISFLGRGVFLFLKRGPQPLGCDAWFRNICGPQAPSPAMDDVA
jgi:hypothetical protein